MTVPFTRILTPTLSLYYSLPHSAQVKCLLSTHQSHCVHSDFCASVHVISFPSQLSERFLLGRISNMLKKAENEIHPGGMYASSTSSSNRHSYSVMLASVSPAFYFLRKKVLLKKTFRFFSVYHLFSSFKKRFFIEYLLYPEAVPGYEEVGRINLTALSCKSSPYKDLPCLTPTSPP